MSTILIQSDNAWLISKKHAGDNLDFITAGPIPPNPSELIISEEMDKLHTPKKLYDIVIIDNPPVGE